MIRAKMQYIEILFIISFGVYGILLGTVMVLNYLLFKSLKKNHIAYYKSIGEPIVIIPFKLTDTEDDVAKKYIRGLKGGFFGYRMIFKGIPKRFPRDTGLRKLTQSIRIITTLMLVAFATCIIMGYFFYESTL